MAQAAAVSGRNERIGTVTLVKGAIARVQAAGWPLLALALGLGAIQLVLQVTATRAGINLAAPTVTPGYLGYAVLVGVVAGLGPALGLRLLIRGREGWLRPGRGLFECAALLGLMASGLMVLNVVMAPKASVGSDASAAAVRSIGLMALYLVAIFVGIKLTLWPIGRLMGHRQVTPARSWRLMRKATRGYILAVMVFGIPFGIVLFGGRAAMGVPLTEITTGTPVLGSFAGAVFAVFSHAVAATLFHLRIESPSSVADVFA